LSWVDGLRLDSERGWVAGSYRDYITIDTCMTIDEVLETTGVDKFLNIYYFYFLILFIYIFTMKRLFQGIVLKAEICFQFLHHFDDEVTNSY